MSKAKIIFSSIMGLLIIFAAVASTLLIAGCKTFEPVQIEGQPDECNDWYTVMKYDVKSGKKEGTMAAIVWPDCKEARKLNRQRMVEKHCKDLVYGKDKLLDKSDLLKYNMYLECIKNYN